MLVVEVDAIHAQPLEAAFARIPNVRRVPADLTGAVVGAQAYAELGGQLHLLPHPTLQSLAKEDLVGVRAIDIGGVEEGDAGAIYADPQHAYTQRLLAAVPVLPQAAE